VLSLVESGIRGTPSLDPWFCILANSRPNKSDHKTRFGLWAPYHAVIALFGVRNKKKI
jgi:hypothetical protein